MNPGVGIGLGVFPSRAAHDLVDPRAVYEKPRQSCLSHSL